MDVRCERCRAQYVFDDEQVTPSGLTVQCTHCGHVFKVKKKELVVTVAVKPEELDRPPLPATAAAPRSSGGGGATSSAQPDGAREWRVRQASGNVFTFRELTTLQKWIVEQKVRRDDEISASSDASWRRLGDIAELATFFQVVEAAERGRRPAPAAPPPLPVPVAASPAPPPPPAPKPIAPPSVFVEVDLGPDDLAALGKGGRGGRIALALLALLLAAGAAGAAAYRYPNAIPLPLSRVLRMSAAVTAPAPSSDAIASAPSAGDPARDAPAAPAPDAAEKATAEAPSDVPPTGAVVAAPDPEPTPLAAPVAVPEPAAPPPPPPEPLAVPAAAPPPAPRAPAGPKALVAQATRLRERGEVERALTLYARAIEVEPRNVAALTGRGLCYLDLETYPPAEASFRAALRVRPDDADALLGLAESYRWQGNRANAIRYYERYLAAHPAGEEANVAHNALEELRK